MVDLPLEPLGFRARGRFDLLCLPLGHFNSPFLASSGRLSNSTHPVLRTGASAPDSASITTSASNAISTKGRLRSRASFSHSGWDARRQPDRSLASTFTLSTPTAARAPPGPPLGATKGTDTNIRWAKWPNMYAFHRLATASGKPLNG